MDSIKPARNRQPWQLGPSCSHTRSRGEAYGQLQHQVRNQSLLTISSNLQHSLWQKVLRDINKRWALLKSKGADDSLSALRLALLQMYTIITSREAQLQAPLGHGTKPVDDCVSSRDHPLLSLICCLLTFPFSACEWEQHGWWPLLSSATDSFSALCWFHIDQRTERLSQILSRQNYPWWFCSDVFKECRALPFSHGFCAVRGEAIYHVTPSQALFQGPRCATVQKQ